MKHLSLAAAAVALALGVAPTVVAQDHTRHLPAPVGSIGVPMTVGQPVTYGQTATVGLPVTYGRPVVVGQQYGAGYPVGQPVYSTAARYPQTYSQPAYGTFTGGVVTYAPASVVGYPVSATAPQTQTFGQPQFSALPGVVTGSSAAPHCSKCASGR